MNFELITLFRELEKNRGGESPRCRRCVWGCADLWPWPYITLVLLADGRQRLLVERLHYFPHFGAAFAQSSHLAISPLLSQPRCLKKKTMRSVYWKYMRCWRGSQIQEHVSNGGCERHFKEINHSSRVLWRAFHLTNTGRRREKKSLTPNVLWIICFGQLVTSQKLLKSNISWP